MIDYDHGKDRVVITLTGGHDIFRFAVNMLDDQTEFMEVGRAILVEQRDRSGARRFDAAARSLLGDLHFGRLSRYFKRDRNCTSCGADVRTPGVRQRIPMGRVLCKGCAR